MGIIFNNPRCPGFTVSERIVGAILVIARFNPLKKNGTFYRANTRFAPTYAPLQGKEKVWRRILQFKGTVIHDNKLSPGDDEIKKISVSSVTSVAKSNFMAVNILNPHLHFTITPNPHLTKSSDIKKTIQIKQGANSHSKHLDFRSLVKKLKNKRG